MRWRQAVLILVLLLGQVHLCRALYTLPDGRECFKCPTLSDKASGVEIAASHGDCHDCCVLKSCDGGHATKAKSAPAISVALYFERPFAFALPSIECFFQSIPYFESAPAHGPPALSGSRGPPCFQLA